MRRIIITVFLIFLLSGCMREQSISSVKNDMTNMTVIIMVDNDTTETDIANLCHDYELSILYHYEMLSGYALQSEVIRSDEEMNQLVEELMTYSFILSAERDNIIELDKVE